MPRLTAFALAVVFLLAPALLMGADALIKAANDLDKLQGRWAVVAADKDGQALLKSELDTMTMEFKDDLLVLKLSPAKGDETGRITLDEGKNPRSMDLKPVPRSGVQRADEAAVPFIYELNGDDLKLCWCKSGGVRPTTFTNEKPYSMMKLRRIKAATQPAATQPDIK